MVMTDLPLLGVLFLKICLKGRVLYLRRLGYEELLVLMVIYGLELGKIVGGIVGGERNLERCYSLALEFDEEVVKRTN